MSENELGRALLDLDSQKLSGASDAREQTWKVLERDRRRVWWLTVLTVATWAAAMLMVLWMLVAFGLLFPQQAKLFEEAEQFNRLTPQMREAAQRDAQITFQMITVGVTCSVGILALASLSTVLLVVITRRATLRQINANLVEISEQLKALRQTPPQAATKQ
jgi:ABC-type Fe3+ transport system permease subunit